MDHGTEQRWRLPQVVAVWLGMMVIAVANGMVREGFLRPGLDELAAHQLSTILLWLYLTILIGLVTRRRPMASVRQAWAIGWLWLGMTLAFEFGIGRFVSGLSWGRMLTDYDVTRGRIWVLIPLWVLCGPAVFFRRRRGS